MPDPATKLRLVAWAAGLAVLFLLVVGATEGCEPAGNDPPTAAERAEEEEDRRKGFHCLSEWDGNHEGLEALVRKRLNDPDSMETIETKIAPANKNGWHPVRMEFTAKNALGGRVRKLAIGKISTVTCGAQLKRIR